MATALTGGWSSMLQSSGPDAKNLGLPIHLKALQCMSRIREKFERQYTWIDEALIEAKRTFASPEIHMIPKTPSAKKSRRAIRQQVIEEEEDDDFENEQPKKKTRTTKSRSAKAKKATSQDEASADTEHETSASESASNTRSTRATRNSRKPASGRTTRTTRQALASTDEDDQGPVLSLESQVLAEQSKGKRKSARNSRSVGRKLNITASVVDESMEQSETNAEKEDEVDAMETASPAKAAPCVVISDSDDSKTPVPQPRVIREAVRRESSRSASTKTPTGTPQSPRNRATPRDGSPSKKPFHMLNVKEKATKYEEFVRTSLGSREASPAGRLTPNSRPCSRGATIVKTVTPRTPQSVRKITPGTPSTYVAKQTLTLKKTVQNNLGASPANTAVHSPGRVTKPVAAPRRRSSARVSGSKLSLSRRRSSIQRHKERSVSGATQAAAQAAAMSHLAEIKARLDSTAPSTTSGDELTKSPVVRSTRSKMRAQQQEATKAQTPDRQSTRSKLRLNKAAAAEPITLSSSGSDERMDSGDAGTPPRRATRSKMRQNKPPPPSLAVDSDDGGTEDEGYKDVQPPSSMAPVRSTRSKMRHLQQQSGSSSPAIKKASLARSDSGKRPAKNSHDHVSPPKKRHMASPDCSSRRSPQRVFTPSHAQSFLHNLKKSKVTTPGNLNNTVTSFLSRNTPSKKPSTKEILEQKRKQLLAKERLEGDRLAKRQESLQKKAEDQRKKREARQLLAAKRREDQLRREAETKKGLSQKLEEKKMMTARMQEEKQREEREKQKLREKRLVDAEQRRKQEEESRQQKLIEMEQEQQRFADLQQRKKEYEDQERLKRIADQRRAQEERAHEAERERAREVERQRNLEDQRLRDDAQQRRDREERERREKAERDRQELERQKERQKQRDKDLEKQRELERQRVLEEKKQQEEKRRAQEEEKKVQKLIKTHNNALQSNTSLNQSTASTAADKPARVPKPNLNNTVSMDNSNASQLNTTYSKDHNTSHEEENVESYKITPVRKVYKPPTEENYNIKDLKSDDSTDDEDQPRKRIPAWASGPQLKASIINQYYKPPDLDKIFPIIEPPDLCKLFAKKKAKFFKRTSSAVWHTPIYMPSGKPLHQ